MQTLSQVLPSSFIAINSFAVGKDHESIANYDIRAENGPFTTTYTESFLPFTTQFIPSIASKLYPYHPMLPSHHRGSNLQKKP
ncbi:hypothetical protein Hanom_Chr16g01419721 [Helianthus anomalus]